MREAGLGVANLLREPQRPTRPVLTALVLTACPVNGQLILVDTAAHQYDVAIGSGGAVPIAKRFTAWAIGIHGPPRESKDAGHSNVESDWTWGCISVSSDAEIEEVSKWVGDYGIRAVEFR